MTKPTGSLGDGKCSGCAVKDHVLTRGDLPDFATTVLVALTAVMQCVIGQKSADGIVVESCIDEAKA